MSDTGTGSPKPNADNEELPDRVPDPATDDLEAGEVATDATAEDAIKSADAMGKSATSQ